MAEHSLNAPRIGVRAHDFGRHPPEELARRVAAAGFPCVQLALAKAIEGMDLSSGRIPTRIVDATVTAFGNNHVGIEILGCYINPVHPCLQTRTGLIALFKEHLRHARAFGCNIVALESGSLNADYSPHLDNHGERGFADLLATLRELVTEAECCGVVVGLEAVTTHVIHTPDRMNRLLREIPSAHLAVVFDPVNLLNVTNVREQSAVIRRSFELFGNRIAAIHAKDFRETPDGLAGCDAGSGQLDYQTLAAQAGRLPGRPAWILDEVSVTGMAASRDFLNNLFTDFIP